MRVVPSRWDNETWVCSVRGHVAPAAHVARLRPDDDALGVELPGGGRLSRCLRCDLWVRTADPAPARAAAEVLPAPDALPHPRRGLALEDAIVTRLIAVERALHCVLFTLAAVVLVLVDRDLAGVRDTASSWSDSLQGAVANSGRGGSHEWLARQLDDVGAWHLDTVRVLLVLAVFYAVVGGAEAWGLWHERRWAEYLTVVETAVLLPFEVAELAHRVTPLRVAMLALNLAVLVWLVWAKGLFGLRGRGAGGRSATDWEAVLDGPPPPAEEARC